MNQCPICYSELEVRTCSPCHDCGGFKHELNHFKEGLHTYKKYEVYDGLKLTLCNFCLVDFGSYDSKYLGFNNGKRLVFTEFNFISEAQSPQLEKDKFCHECGHRLKFLTFLVELRNKLKSE